MPDSSTAFGFSRDLEFGRRIDAGDTDKFRIRALDFIADTILSEQEVLRFVAWLSNEFESLRAVLIGQSSELKLTFLSGANFEAQVVAVDGLAEARARKDDDVLRAGAAINLLAQIPFSVIAYQARSDRRTLVRVLCSHLAMDYVTYRLMRTAAAEWWANPSRIAPSRPTYGEWLSDYRQYVDSPAGRAETEHWSKLSVDPFRRAKEAMVKCSGTSLVNTAIVIPPPLVGALRERCRGLLQCRLPEAVSAILVSALSTAFGLEQVPLTWTAHGRGPVSGRSFHAVPGWLSSLHPVVIPANAPHPQTAIALLRDGFDRCPNRGNTFAWVERFVTDTAWRTRASELSTPFRINIRESIARELKAKPNAPAKLSPVVKAGRPVPHRRGTLHFHIVADIGATVVISIRSACDIEDQACRKLSAAMENAILLFASDQ
jgi:hypothetical protein